LAKAFNFTIIVVLITSDTVIPVKNVIYHNQL